MVVDARGRRSPRRRTTSAERHVRLPTRAPAGSVLLDLRRQAPAGFDVLTFLNTPGAAGVFNVKTAAVGRPDQLHQLDRRVRAARRSRTTRTA